MSKPEITVYLKTHCGWSQGVRAALAKYGLAYAEKDIILNPEYRAEMEQLSGQPLSPCVVVNGEMLPDIGGEELENYLLAKGLVASAVRDIDIPLHSSCSPHKDSGAAKL